MPPTIQSTFYAPLQVLFVRKKKKKLFHQNKHSNFTLLKVLLQSGGLNIKVIAGVITIKACYGVSKKCANNIHFTDTAKANLQVLFKVKKFERIDDITEKPLH